MSNDDTQQHDKARYHCDTCNSGLRLVHGEHGSFWGCQNKECQSRYTLVDGKMVLKKRAEKSDHDCVACTDGKLCKHETEKGVFWGCSNFPNCKQNFGDLEGVPDFEGVLKRKKKEAKAAVKDGMSVDF